MPPRSILPWLLDIAWLDLGMCPVMLSRPSNARCLRPYHWPTEWPLSRDVVEELQNVWPTGFVEAMICFDGFDCPMAIICMIMSWIYWLLGGHCKTRVTIKWNYPRGPACNNNGEPTRGGVGGDKQHNPYIHERIPRIRANTFATPTPSLYQINVTQPKRQRLTYQRYTSHCTKVRTSAPGGGGPTKTCGAR